MNQTLFDWDEDGSETASGTASSFPNELIRASAGTGKTYQLSNRYIALAQACEHPDDILAATFARKAAGEILDRVVLRLAEAALQPEKLAELEHVLKELSPREKFDQVQCSALLAKIIRNLHRLRISTLDSFFVQIAGSFGLELGLPPGWTIVDEVTDQRLKSLAIQDVLGDAKPADLLTLLHLLNKGEVSRAVSQQIRFMANELHNLYCETTPEDSQGNLPAAWGSIPRCKALSDEEWQQAVESLGVLEFPGNKRLQNVRDRDLEAACSGDWEKLAGAGLVKAIVEGGGLYYKKPLPPEVLAVYAPLVEHVKSQIVNRYADQTESTWKLLDRFHRAYQRLKTEQRAYRFGDITQMLSQAMREMDSGQLAFRLDAHVGHLLLDEFQDTSLLQWSVLQPFAEVAAQDAGRSFFCVGDVKQAIYGWRGGVADLFASLDQQLPGLTNRELTCSFRSSQTVIDVVNRVFGGLSSNPVMAKLPGVADVWRERFQTHTTARDFSGYCVLQTASSIENDDESQQVETLKFAAQEVARLHRESPRASIGILVRKNSAVARMIFELRSEHGIEASEEGGNPLLDSAAVQLVLSLLSLADHPGDTIARFHVANSPLGPIAGLRDHRDSAAARQVSSQIRQSLLERGYGATIYDWVRELTSSCNDRELNRLMQLVSLACRYENQATEQAEDFIAMVTATKVEDPSAADVRVMNIHQSKGLQFDIVVLPELDGRIGGLTPPVVVGRKTPTSPVESVFRYIPSNVLPFLPDRFAAMLEQSNQQGNNESLCLLYVAMTRAVHALHLIVAPSRESEKSLPKSFAGILRSALHEGSLQNAPNQILFEHGEKNWFAKSQASQQFAQDEPTAARMLRIQLRETTGKPSRRLRRQAPSGFHGGTGIDIRKCFREDSILSRQRGSLWHAWLEHIDWLDDDSAIALPDEESFQRIAGQFLHPRLKFDEEFQEFREALARPTIRQACTWRQYADLLTSRGLEAPKAVNSTPSPFKLYREYPIAYRENQTLVQGTIDRLVLLMEGDQPFAADMIDFKTDRIPRNSAGAIEKLGKSYGPQLSAYVAAIQQAFSLPKNAIQARLVFLHADATWTLPEHSP